MRLHLVLLTLLPAAVQQIAAQQNAAQFDVTTSQRNTTGSSASLLWAARMGSNSRAALLPLRDQSDSDSRIPVSVITSFGATSNPTIINGSSIAFVSCDPVDYQQPGNIGPAMVFIMALQNNAAAIVLYSKSSPSCELTGSNIPDYPRVWSLITPFDAERIQTDEVSSPFPIIGQIGSSLGNFDYNAFANLTNPGGASTQQQPPPQRPQNMNTQVAMIILYTVTGVVTCLFLVIITTGALRAHRHPERYGPRNILGRPRQTRARGLARAMLDSLPIVKFSDPSSPKPDDTARDAELAETDPARTSTDPNLKDGETADSTAATTPHVSGDSPETASVRSGIGPAEDAIAAAQSKRNSVPGLGIAPPPPGCSICTEDFEDGQDLRVLPCDHKFHPACVDPWLLNVSGTCPLCRIDLRRGSQDGSDDDGVADGTDDAEHNGELPPPLEMEQTTGGRELERSYRSSFRRSLLVPVFGARGTNEGNRDEVLEILRRWRDDRRRNGHERGASVDGPVERERRRRLSRVFGVRTRRQGRGSMIDGSGEGGMGNGDRGETIAEGATTADPDESTTRNSVETSPMAEAEGVASSAVPARAIPNDNDATVNAAAGVTALQQNMNGTATGGQETPPTREIDTAAPATSSPTAGSSVMALPGDGSRTSAAEPVVQTRDSSERKD
ncbi:hypothetical protein CAC42_3261 [Sphaceloma murrayae]|uniref:RING-type domain-containing protein n=1 Tax=Sphaceloma murrayae TaxID=2082308 RepID=A0A2K1QFE9_9PEZI|nr:hypothetical protein CAC42_3261 [Sphaceloma murrayae]